MFKDEKLSQETWKSLERKEKVAEEKKATFERGLELEKKEKAQEREEAIRAFEAFGCGYAWEAERMLLSQIEAHILGAVEEE